nr:hypothetical protein [Tanacetum cinerariifolium]
MGFKMRVFMQGQGVWEAIESRTRNTAIDVKKDKLALASIYQGIPEDLLLSLAEKQTAKDAWETLKTTFMGAERVKTAKVQTLKAKFETLSMKDTEIIDDFTMKLNNIVSNIRSLGERVEDAYVVKKLLRAVPSKFLQIASTIEQFTDLDNMTVEEVIARLKSHEERISKKKGDEEKRTSQRNTRSNVSNNRGRGRGRGRGNYSNRGGRRGGGSYLNRDGGRGSTSNYDKSKVQCYNCQDLRHYAYECKNPRKERNHEANLTQKDDERALLLFVRHEVNEEVFLNEKHVTPKLKNLNEESNTSKVCYLDNGACNHMAGDREKFSDINRSVQGEANGKRRLGDLKDDVHESRKGEKVEDAYVVKKLLRAVPSKFLQIASTIEQFADLDNMTVEEVIGRLKSHEERVCGQSKSGEGRLLLTHQEWLEISKKKGDEEQRTSQRNTRSNVSNNRGRGGGRGRGNYSNRGGRRGGGSYQNRDGGRGSTSNYDKKRNHEANLTQKDDERALLLFVRHEVNEEVFLNEKHVTPKLKNLNEESNTSKVWYLDNGACNHMTGDREKFSDINRSVQGYVWFGDGSKVKIKENGSITFVCKNGEKRVLQDVYHIPSLCNNIISLGQLSKHGDMIQISGAHLWVHDKNGKLLMKVNRSPNRLYKIVLNEVEPRCLFGEHKEHSWLWHSRLGHVNFQKLKEMCDKNLVHGLKAIRKPHALGKAV